MRAVDSSGRVGEKEWPINAHYDVVSLLQNVITLLDDDDDDDDNDHTWNLLSSGERPACLAER